MAPLFSQWLTQSILGQYLLEQEYAFFDHAAADVFGFCAVQVGLPEVNFLRKNRIPRQCIVTTQTGGNLVCDPAHLPFASRSLDLLILPHVLDFTVHPHHVLREGERVLVGEGRLILTGFNPLSLWGLRRLIQGQFSVPWRAHFFSLARIKDWLALLGLEPGCSTFMAYAPPVEQSNWLHNCHFMETAGERWWPLAAGVYGIEAVKRQQGMRLITPQWKPAKPALLAAGRKGQRLPVSKNRRALL